MSAIFQGQITDFHFNVCNFHGRYLAEWWELLGTSRLVERCQSMSPPYHDGIHPTTVWSSWYRCMLALVGGKDSIWLPDFIAVFPSHLPSYDGVASEMVMMTSRRCHDM